MSQDTELIKKQVQHYEHILNHTTQLIRQMDELTQRLQSNEADYRSLVAYYGSEVYRQGMELSETTNALQDINCGVLSEHAVFNLMIEYRELSIKLLQTATTMLQDE
ncbi:DUF4298 domain-containing protein [Aerococcaceae bacterium DSM 111020]|nr:DUF4298 domain-containing protein [Aerococcaceae bacterium DSM 111020]